MTPVLRSLLKDTILWQSLRGLKRSLLPQQHDTSLPVDECRGRVTWLNPPPIAEVGTILPVQLKLENRANRPWISRGQQPVRLQLRWLTRFGEPFDSPPIFQELPTLYPGEPYEMTVPMPLPDVVGDFVLSVDFIQSERSFTSLHSESQGVATPLTVMGSRTTDIDYHAVFRTANLNENHWWVVGAYHSKEQYERSARERLEMLLKQGLTNDSHVLDIGCGTGQMASVLLTYLTERGRYAGTDIGREAIAFCQENFRRRNFDFAVGEMTDVPFHDDGTFDLAIFFSVFTHTFLDETALLLAEAKRLLKPTGTIIVDVITSPLVERSAGHRGEMVVNRDYFLKLAAMLGYQPEVIGKWPWNRHADRYMFKLTRTLNSSG